MTTPRVLIATPTLGSVKTGYMKSVLATCMSLARNGIQSAFETIDNQTTPTARNILATKCLTEGFTHIFFTDSDMIWHETMCQRFIAFDKPVVGAVYPRKQMNIQNMLEAAKRGASAQEAILFGLEWIVALPKGETSTAVKDAMMRAGRIGFGSVLIKRETLEIMVERGVAKPQTMPRHGTFYNFFTPRPEANGMSVSEDFSFCDRWTIDCNGDIWVATDAPIYHVGDYAFGGNYHALLDAGARMKFTTATTEPTP